MKREPYDFSRGRFRMNAKKNILQSMATRLVSLQEIILKILSRERLLKNSLLFPRMVMENENKYKL